MFKIQTNDVNVLRVPISILSEFVAEANFVVSKNGINCVATDPSGASMTIIEILPSAFTSFSVDVDEEVYVNLENLKNALKRVKVSDIVSVSTEKNRLLIDIIGVVKKKFYVPMLEPEKREQKVPSFSYKVRAEMVASSFAEYIEDVMSVSDTVTFKAGSNKLTIYANSAQGRVEIDLLADSEALLSFKSEEDNVDSIYTCEYLRKIAKASAI